MKKENKSGFIKGFKYNSFVYLKRIASSVRELLKSRFLNNCGEQKMNKEKEKEMDEKSLLVTFFFYLLGFEPALIPTNLSLPTDFLFPNK